MRDAALVDAIETAGWAPFHYDRRIDGICEPWRATLLTHEACRLVAERLPGWLEASGGGAGKLPAMFAACGAAVVVTWIPERASDGTSPEKFIAINEEHLAASAAFVQNLLLLLTDLDFGTYWSSGGKLRDPAIATHLDIDPDQRLLAIVFVDYPESRDQQVERIPGKLRDKRCTRWLNTWTPAS